MPIILEINQRLIRIIAAIASFYGMWQMATKGEWTAAIFFQLFLFHALSSMEEDSHA